MKVVLCMMSHKKLIPIAKIVGEYYSQFCTVEIQSFNFIEDQEQDCRNKFYSQHLDCDFVLTIDNDEIILPEDMEYLFHKLNRRGNDVYQCHIMDYLSPNNIMANKRTHVPIIAINPNCVKFIDKRCAITTIPNSRLLIETLSFDIHHLWYLNGIGWKEEQYTLRGIEEKCEVGKFMAEKWLAIHPPETVVKLQRKLEELNATA